MQTCLHLIPVRDGSSSREVVVQSVTSVNVGLPRDIAWQGQDRSHRRLETASECQSDGTTAES
jgi:hypothetical protein